MVATAIYTNYSYGLKIVAIFRSSRAGAIDDTLAQTSELQELGPSIFPQTLQTTLNQVTLSVENVV